MLIELIAVVTAGFAAAGIALLATRLVHRLPRWLVPVAAGAALIGAAITLEYAWYGRTAGALPDSVEVALAHEARAPWRPWTYLAPYRDRFIAVDHASRMTSPAAEAQRLVDLLIFGRWALPTRIRAVFDCAEGRRADLGPGVTLAEDGRIEGATWHETGLDDPLTRTACKAA